MKEIIERNDEDLRVEMSRISKLMLLMLNKTLFSQRKARTEEHMEDHRKCVQKNFQLLKFYCTAYVHSMTTVSILSPLLFTLKC